MTGGFRNSCPQLRARGFGIADALALAATILFIFWLGHTLLYQFPYDWKWKNIPQFLLVHTEEGWAPGVLGKGLLTTIRLAFWSSAGAFLVGIILAMGRTSNNQYLAMLAGTTIELSRNLPPLVLVFVFYYFLGSQLLPWADILHWMEDLPQPVKIALQYTIAPVSSMDVFLPAVFTLSLYEGAYMAEIFRGGLESIPRGQWEASYCLGFTRLQQYRFIVGPQLLRNVLPQLSSQFISTVKDSSIVSVISIEELTYSGLQLMATIKQPFEVWLTIACLYMVLTLSLSLLLRRWENGR